MKFRFQLGLASLLLVLATLVPASAYASNNPTSAHEHTHQEHDRTPTAHVRGTHSHRG